MKAPGEPSHHSPPGTPIPGVTINEVTESMHFERGIFIDLYSIQILYKYINKIPMPLTGMG